MKRAALLTYPLALMLSIAWIAGYGQVCRTNGNFSSAFGNEVVQNNVTFHTWTDACGDGIGRRKCGAALRTWPTRT